MAIHSFLIITKILVYSQYFIICLYIIYALPFFFFFLKPNLSIGFTLQFDSSASGCAHSVSLQFHSLPQGQYSYSQNHCLFFIPILKIPRFCFMLSFFFLNIFSARSLLDVFCNLRRISWQFFFLPSSLLFSSSVLGFCNERLRLLYLLVITY